MPNDRLLAVYPDGTYRTVPCTYAGIKDGLHDAVFDYLKLDDDVGMYIDDEGMLNGGVFNVPASLLMCRPIWGPVVVCHGEPDPEGNTLPPDIELIQSAVALARTWEFIRSEAIRLGQDIDHVANDQTVPPPRIISLDDEAFEQYLTNGTIPEGDDQ